MNAGLECLQNIHISKIDNLEKKVESLESELDQAKNVHVEFQAVTKNKYEKTHAEYESAKKILHNKLKEQESEIQDLKDKVCKANDDKNEAIKIIGGEHKLQISSLETSNLEIKLRYDEVLEQLKNYEKIIAENENAKEVFENKSKDQESEISDLKYNLCNMALFAYVLKEYSMARKSTKIISLCHSSL